MSYAMVFVFGWVIQIAVIFLLVKLFTGGKGRHLRWLQKELPAWEKEALISPLQSNAIQGFYKLKRSAYGRKMDMIKVLTTVGALFIGLGVIFFVASNWQKLPNFTRVTLLLLITISTLFAGYIYSYEKQGWPQLGKALVLLSALFWGGSISLIGQIYNVSVGDNWLIVLLWALPIIPVAIFFKNNPVNILVTILFFIWNFLYSSSFNAPNYWYPIIIFVLILPLVKNNVVVRRLNILGLLIAAYYCSFYQYGLLALFISLGLLAYYLFNRQERGYIYAATIALIIWSVTYFLADKRDPNLYFLLPIAFVFYITYKDGLRNNLVLALVALTVWLNLLVFSFPGIGHGVNMAHMAVFQVILSCIIYSLGVISLNRNYQFADVYKSLGAVIAFIYVYLLSFRGLFESWSTGDNLYYLVGSFILLGLAMLLIFDQFKSGYFIKKAARLELGALLSVILGCAFVLTKTGLYPVNVFICNALLLIFALVAISLGVELKKTSIFTSGVFVFALFIITRYIDVGWKLKEKSLFFIVGGLIILLIGVLMEKQRRVIIERIKSNE